jgi:voltage-gated potassium channel
VTQPASTERFQRFAKATEWPLGVLALLIIPSILLDDHVHRLGFHEIALWLNWIVWLAFCGELAVKAWLAPDRRYFLRHAWFDLLIVVLSPPFIGPEYLQGLRAVRLVRLARLLRFVRAVAVAGIALESARDVLAHRKLHYVVLATIVIVSLGAFGIYGVEHGSNPAMGSIGDAFWWAVVTATTVGYGDISPTTTEGRLIAVLLMLVGIGAISILTATVASFFSIRTSRSARLSSPALTSGWPASKQNRTKCFRPFLDTRKSGYDSTKPSTPVHQCPRSCAGPDLADNRSAARIDMLSIQPHQRRRKCAERHATADSRAVASEY